MTQLQQTQALRKHFKAIRRMKRNDIAVRGLCTAAIQLTRQLDETLARIGELEFRHVALCETIDRLNSRERHVHAN